MITFANVSVERADEMALHDVSFQVDEGEFVCITGPTGAGKTTILKLIYMDLLPTRGLVAVGDFSSANIRPKEIPELRRKVGMIFQDFRLLHDRNIYENVAFALWATGVNRKEIKPRVLRVLTNFELGHRRDYFPDRLSDGQKQKVSVARALVKEPFVLLADEPTGNLDPDASRDLLELLQRVNAQGTAVLMATHDISLIEGQGFRTLRVERGELVDDGK